MSTDAFPPISGGLPTKSQDLVASIIFSAVFTLLLGPAVWRMASSGSRTTVIIRPMVFCLAQAIAYGMRAAIANGVGSTELYEASEILLLAGFILICEPVPALLTRLIGKKDPNSGRFGSRNDSTEVRALAVLRVMLLVALILGIVAATSISDHESASTIASIKNYRIANASLVIAAILGSAILACLIMKSGSIEKSAVFFLVVQCGLIMLTAGYKLESTLRPAGNTSVGGKTAFYLLNSTVQWLITAWYFTFNLNTLFPDISKTSKTHVLGGRWASDA